MIFGSRKDIRIKRKLSEIYVRFQRGFSFDEHILILRNCIYSFHTCLCAWL